MNFQREIKKREKREKVCPPAPVPCSGWEVLGEGGGGKGRMAGERGEVLSYFFIFLTMSATGVR